VIALKQNAERAKPPITRLLERYANRYLVLVLLVAAVTWFVNNDAQAMLAVVVAARPCALAIAAPAWDLHSGFCIPRGISRYDLAHRR
jgi:cation transport ATPase